MRRGSKRVERAATALSGHGGFGRVFWRCLWPCPATRRHVAMPGPRNMPVNATRANGGPRGRESVTDVKSDGNMPRTLEILSLGWRILSRQQVLPDTDQRLWVSGYWHASGPVSQPGGLLLRRARVLFSCAPLPRGICLGTSWCRRVPKASRAVARELAARQLVIGLGSRLE